MQVGGGYLEVRVFDLERAVQLLEHELRVALDGECGHAHLHGLVTLETCE